MTSLVPPPADTLDLPDLKSSSSSSAPTSAPPQIISAPPRTLPPDFLKTATHSQPLPAPARSHYAPQQTPQTQPLPVQTRSQSSFRTPQTQPLPAPARSQSSFQTPQTRFTQPVQSDDFLQHFLFVFQTAAENLDAQPGSGTAYQVGHAIESLGAILPDAEIRESFRDYASKYPLHNYLTTTADCLGWIYAALDIPVPTPAYHAYPKMREDMGYPSQEIVQRPIFPFIPPNLRTAGVLGTPANYRVGFNKQHARSLERLQYSAQRFRRSTRN